LLAGCGGSAPPPVVEAGGVVLLDGAPLPKAKVRFVPRIEQSSAYIAQGVTDEEGRFALTCHGQSGACATECLVTVCEDDLPEELTEVRNRDLLDAHFKSLKNRPIPVQYTNLASSTVSVKVTPEQKEYKIELRR
jgi:hypothetical protein